MFFIEKRGRPRFRRSRRQGCERLRRRSAAARRSSRASGGGGLAPTMSVQGLAAWAPATRLRRARVSLPAEGSAVCVSMSVSVSVSLSARVCRVSRKLASHRPSTECEPCSDQRDRSAARNVRGRLRSPLGPRTKKESGPVVFARRDGARCYLQENNGRGPRRGRGGIVNRDKTPRPRAKQKNFQSRCLLTAHWPEPLRATRLVKGERGKKSGPKKNSFFARRRFFATHRATAPLPAHCRRSPIHVTSRPGRSWRQQRHRRGPVPPTLVRFRRATRVRAPRSRHPSPGQALCARPRSLNASRGQHPCVSERPPTPVSVHACAAARATLARATATTSPRSRPPAAQRRGARRAQQTAPRRRPPSRAAPRPGPRGPPRRASRPFPPQPPTAPARRLLLPARPPVHLSEPPFNLGQLASSGGHVAP